MLKRIGLNYFPKGLNFLGKTNLLEEKSSTNTIFVTLLIILLSLNFILLGINEINMATDPEYGDTASYLGEANFIKRSGGVTDFLKLCITGKYEQANRHPLYMMVLSAFASTDISFFIHAKITSFAIGLILLLCLFFIGKKMYGYACASIAVFGLMLNAVFLRWTSLVAPESLLMLLSILCMYFVIRGFQNNRLWLLAGMCAGLAYLTKASGLLLIPGFGLSSLIVYRLKIFRNKYFWSFFILFLLVGSPLIIRNIKVYKDPFFNVNTYMITVGKGELQGTVYKVFSPVEGQGLWRFESESKAKELKSTNHTVNIFDLSKRLVSGVLVESEIFSNTLIPLPVKQFFSQKFRWLFALSLLSLFVVGLIRERDLGGKIYVIITSLLFLIFLSFNPHDRYYLPVIPIMWIYTAFAVVTILGFIDQHFKLNITAFIPHSVVGILIVTAGYLLSTQSITGVLNSVEYTDSRRDLVNWLRANLGEEDRYTLGPNINWQLDKGTWFVPSKNMDWEGFNQFVKIHDISYVIIDWPARRDLGRIKIIESHFELDPEEGMVQKGEIKGWDLVYKDQKTPVEFLIYKLVRQGSGLLILQEDLKRGSST